MTPSRRPFVQLPRLSRQLKYLLAVPLAAAFLYAMWQWSMFLGEHAFSDDRYFHTLALTENHAKATEPLWGYLGPALGSLTPHDPFIAASVATMVLFLVGMYLTNFDRASLILVAFSPGLAYFATNALRQGIAVGIFMVLIGLTRDRSSQAPGSYRSWVVLLMTVPAVMVHNSVIVAALYLLMSNWFLSYSAPGRRSQLLQVLLAIGGGVLLAAAPVFGSLTTTGVALVAMVWTGLVGSTLTRKLRTPLIPVIGVFLLAVASGFLFTSAGLRTLLMVCLLAPLAIGRHGTRLTLLSCWAYPVALALFGTFESDLGPFLIDEMEP